MIRRKLSLLASGDEGSCTSRSHRSGFNGAYHSCYLNYLPVHELQYLHDFNLDIFASLGEDTCLKYGQPLPLQGTHEQVHNEGEIIGVDYRLEGFAQPILTRPAGKILECQSQRRELPVGGKSIDHI